MTRIHYPGFAEGSWKRLELVDQLGNVGMEVERTIGAKEAGEADEFRLALERAIELFNYTVNDPRWNAAQRREVLRARNEFCRLFFDPDVPADYAERLRRYFFGFMWLSRLRHAEKHSGASPDAGRPLP